MVQTDTQNHVNEDAKLHSTIARTVSALLASDDFWNAFSSTATTMRTTLLNQ